MGKAAVLIAIAAIACLALATGCGGSDEASSETTASIPKQQYVKRAGEICDKAEEEKYEQIGAAYKLATAGGKEVEPDVALLEKLTRTVVVPVLRDMAQELQELPPSAKDQAQFEKAIEALEEELDKTEKQPKLFIESKAFDKTNAELGKAGVPDCLVNQ